MMRLVPVLIIVLFHATSSATEPGGTEDFRAGLKDFREARYGEALEKFERAYLDLPVVGDYILYYISSACLEAGRHEDSLKAARQLLARYPETTLTRKARALEIKGLIKSDRRMASELLESYVRAYPSDEEMSLLYARLLREKGLNERADAVFRAVYIEAGPLSGEAYKGLMEKELSRRDLIRRAKNLTGNGSYGKAESLLRTLLTKDNYNPREDILENLGLALFRQKKYNAAAKVYLKLNDLYNVSLSLLRAGRRDEFYKTMDEMLSRKDGQAAELFVALADDLRREGNTESALELLEEAMRNFPLIKEKALWTTAWTHYTTRNYAKAAEVFTGLHETYKSNKYLYWKARSLEKAGVDASGIYRELEDLDFYTFLARTKTSVKKLPAVKYSVGKNRRRPMERIDILIEAGLTDEAARELSAMSRKNSRHGNLLDIAFKLMSIGKYRNAMLLIDLLPDGIQPHEILYPMAYWPTVEKVSSMYSLDPFLLLSLIREESRFDPMALSGAGAIGLMQLMPHTARRTARSLNIKIDGTKSISEIENNIRLGTHYLHGLLKEFKSVTAALAAYNAGENRVRKWLKRNNYESYDEFVEDIPYKETRNYVKRIVTTYFYYQVVCNPEHTGVSGIL